MLTIANFQDIEFIIESQILMAKETEDFELDRQHVTQGVHSVLASSTLGQYWLWKKDNRPISCLLLIDEWSDWRRGMVGWIHSVFVLPEYRGQKIFRNMYEQLQIHLTEKRSNLGLRLYVDRRNTTAQKVYDSLGMDGEHYKLYEWVIYSALKDRASNTRQLYRRFFPLF